VAAPNGVAVNVTLVPAQIVLSASLLVKLTIGFGLTVVVIAELVTLQLLALVTRTRTAWLLVRVLVA
jgi:hypothetical protein